MTVIVCIDDDMGMTFNRRRQSQDKVLRNRIIGLSRGHGLKMNSYSAKQFGDTLPEYADVSENFLNKARSDDICFVEDAALAPFLPKIDKLIVFRWNRKYPSDKKLDIPLPGGFRLCSSDLFAGSSHEKITEEVYVK